MSDFEKDLAGQPPSGDAEQPSSPPGDSADAGSSRQQSAMGSQNMYWSNQDARRASNGYQAPYQGGYNNNYYQPYQYSANAGWQNTAPKNDKNQWDFQDYDKISSPGKKKKNRGLVIFAVSLLCVLALSLVALSGITVYNSLVEEEAGATSGAADGPGGSAGRGEDGDRGSGDEGLGAAGDASEMTITNKPEITETLPVGGKMTIPQVAESVSPSVVGVITYQNAQFFEPFGTGSGIIMSEDGYIITNAHVVADSDAIKVILHNDEPYEARLIGSDARTDLAVIKIEETGLVAASFGDSNQLQVGETVIAIGNPAGTYLAGSVTQGIVSALNRNIQAGGYSMTYIQTDAAINPGNSGGALVNEYGQVIGINSSKIVAEGYEGIGFAIPISEAKPVIDDLLLNGRVTGRVMLGITGQTVDEIMAKNYDVPMGMQIMEISEDADISGKGVQTGDIITHIDGERIYTFDDVREILDQHKPGDSVRLTIYRQSNLISGSSYDVNVTLHEDMGN